MTLVQRSHRGNQANRVTHATSRLKRRSQFAHGTQSPHGQIDVKIEKFI